MWHGTDQLYDGIKNLSSQVFGVDNDENAIQLCNKNKGINQVLNNIEFYLADFFNTSGYLKSNFDLVVSNPPYFIDQLESTVQKEPVKDTGQKGIDKIL